MKRVFVLFAALCVVVSVAAPQTASDVEKSNSYMANAITQNIK
jgi:hypothetical protein